MSDILLVQRKPTADELFALRKSVGWRLRDKKALQLGLDNSLYGICAVDNGHLVGTARVVGDGITVFYIQDVIVHPEYQRMGIGRAMMEQVMSYISEHACNGAVVGLMAAKGKESFYEAYGFQIRPDENLGAGMTQFWKKTE